MNNKTLIPTQLFVGEQNLLDEKVEMLLREHFCSNKSEGCYCNQCRKIQNHQHESIVWISPEKDYSVKDIDIIFEKTAFALDEEQKFFFILEKANRLNLATANKLLKLLEEPPFGYNFILCTNNKNMILPTIVSRCHVVSFGEEREVEDYTDSLLAFFYNQDFDNPLDFEAQLKRSDLNDSKSVDLFFQMFNSYSRKVVELYKQMDSIENLKFHEKVVSFLKLKIEKLPRSGSAKLFWKNLYINFPRK